MTNSVRRPRVSAVCFAALLGAACAFGAPAGATTNKASVTTYHNDNYRTGWNQDEITLTPSTVSGGSFGMVASVSLDDQVDAQTLVVPNQAISGQGTHDVVYVATESNSIYAVDAYSGAVLLQVNFGAPVPYTDLPGGCNNNGPNIGINSTPVIDPNSSTMYVITYTLESGNQTFRIHALDLSTLTDKVPSVVVTASGTLNNGQTYNFQAAQTRQRPGLLLSNGNVYAGFGSFCDIDANVSRGWVLGWQTGTLTPLPANHLNNLLASSQDDFFLTSVWMSGYGLAADTGGDIYFVTGNSDYGGNSWNKKHNLSESVIELSSDLTRVESWFSPTDVRQLEQEDGDFGSGGVMLLPPQTGNVSNVAVAAGKDGNMYFLDADKLGKVGGDIASYNVGGCWCGQSYFQSANTDYVVASGGNNANIYSVQARKKGKPSLVHVATSGGVPNGQDPGFFTSVSTNGTQTGSAVIWAVSRPTDGNPADIYLSAFDQNGQSLYSGLAGTWPNTGGNSNIVPTVANGMVYVASDQSLALFGLGANNRHAQLPPVKFVDTRVQLAPGEHEIHGVVRSMNGNLLTVATRDGSLIKVDTTLAEKNSRMAQPAVGTGLLARGSADATGIFRANAILHAKKNPAMWPSDR
jgi:hypothetical protein